MLKWFGHAERMGRVRPVEKAYRTNVEGNRGRGRPLTEGGEMVMMWGGLNDMTLLWLQTLKKHERGQCPSF